MSRAALVLLALAALSLAACGIDGAPIPPDPRLAVVADAPMLG